MTRWVLTNTRVKGEKISDFNYSNREICGLMAINSDILGEADQFIDAAESALHTNIDRTIDF